MDETCARAHLIFQLCVVSRTKLHGKSLVISVKMQMLAELVYAGVFARCFLSSALTLGKELVNVLMKMRCGKAHITREKWIDSHSPSLFLSLDSIQQHEDTTPSHFAIVVSRRRCGLFAAEPYREVRGSGRKPSVCVSVENNSAPSWVVVAGLKCHCVVVG